MASHRHVRIDARDALSAGFGTGGAPAEPGPPGATVTGSGSDDGSAASGPKEPSRRPGKEVDHSPPTLRQLAAAREAATPPPIKRPRGQHGPIRADQFKALMSLTREAFGGLVGGNLGRRQSGLPKT